MGCSQSSATGKPRNPLPIDTNFKLPSSLTTWPADVGEGFASGAVDLGGLQICEISSFTKIWVTYEGGPENKGATFSEPSSLPDGFFMLGCYSQPNNRPFFGWVLAAKDTTNDPSGGALKPPIDYTLVWNSESSKIKQEGKGYIWLPTPPDGYRAIGHVVTSTPEKPSLDKIRCVRLDFTDVNENERWIWGLGKEIDSNGFNVYSSRPRDIGTEALSVSTGTFVAQNGGTASSLASLKNISSSLISVMPNLDQIQALFQAYSPLIYFHPDEEYFPSSVTWYFENGVLLYQKGDESKPVPIEPTGSNLPEGGSNDGAYWLDLPTDNAAKERVKKGDLQDSEAYLHVKPMLGGTFTDIAIWVFYPFNGPARAKVVLINIPLGKIGQHIGDWEHMTLRVSNFNGELKGIYFSQHSKGEWVNASELEFQNGTKPVAYSSLHGHAFYPKAGLVLQGSRGIGLRNDSAKSKNLMDTGKGFSVVAAEYLGESIVAEPPWLNYAREWGPKITYDIGDELNKVEKLLPGGLKTAFRNVMGKLPNEVFGEEGPTGPKSKDYWNGDERA